MPKLNNSKRERFCQEYIVDGNATQAAIRAGYAPKAAAEQGSRLLTFAKVEERLDELRRHQQIRTETSADWVLERLVYIQEKCLTEGEHWNPAAANKALELIGKHHEMFTDVKKHVFAHEDELAEIEAMIAKSGKVKPNGAHLN